MNRYKGKLKTRPLSRSYELTPDLLGRGGYGEVWRGLRTAPPGGKRESVAVKIVPLPSEPELASRGRGRTELKATLMELEVMARVGHHDNLLTLREAFVEEGRLYLVTDVMETDMCEFMLNPRVGEEHQWGERDVCRFMFSLLKGLAHLHAYGIVHRDVKLDNIMLRRADDPGSAHLGDFGLAAVASKATGAVGSLQYVAPEVLVSREGQDFYDTSADMWSVGVVLYAILGRKFPFGAGRKESTTRKICNGVFDFSGPAWRGVTDSAKDLIRRLLEIDPASRITAQEALRHQWLSSVAAEEEVNRKRAKSADSRFWRSGVRDIMQQLAGLLGSSTPQRGLSTLTDTKRRETPALSITLPSKPQVTKLPPLRPLR